MAERSKLLVPKKKRVFHPVFFALCPLLGLYAQNTDKVAMGDLARPAMLLVLVATGLWFLCWVLLRDRFRGGISASAMVIAFFVLWGVLEDGIRWIVPKLSDWPHQVFYIGYGAVVVVAFGTLAWLFRSRRHALAIRALVLAFVAVAWFLVAAFLLAPVFGRRAAWLIAGYLIAVFFVLMALWRYEGNFKVLNRTANWFSGVLLLLYAGLSALNAAHGHTVEPRPLAGLTAEASAAAEGEAQPDIYLITLDGYARGDVLRDTPFTYNSWPFEQWLGENGMTFARQSRANYPSTLLSLTSCLNMDYLCELIDEGDRASGDVQVVKSLYDQNRAVRFLRERGYEIVVFSPGYENLEMRGDVDRRLAPPRAPREFEMVLMNQTVVSRVMEIIYYMRYGNPAAWRVSYVRERILHAFEELPKLAEEGGKPKFVVAHLSVPEAPFLFTRDGGLAHPYGPGSVAVDQVFEVLDRDFHKGYIDQLDYVNGELRGTISAILERSATPPVILVASSRGASKALPSSVNPASVPPERFKNLLFAYLPGPGSRQDCSIYDTMGMANLFRVTFNNVFGTELPLVPDGTVMGTNENPFDSDINFDSDIVDKGDPPAATVAGP
jgi:hypothetical protein